MTKLEELIKDYEEAKLEGKISNIILEIHMPTGETEVIINPNVEEKINYIRKAYTEELVHKGCKEIYIENYNFCYEESFYDFGWALTLLKNGKKVARKGWNGKGMYLFLANGDDLSNCLFKKEDNVKCQDSICMYTAQGTICVGWLASQADMLAEDWDVVE